MKKTIILSQRLLTAVGCANGNGGLHLGCEHAVNILRSSEFLRNMSVSLNWKKVVEETATGRHFAALAGVTQTCRELAEHTRQVIAKGEEELVVFGGDHSCAMGTWSGVATALRPKGDLGLIWVDAHMDAHTPSTSPSGNLHGMPVAHLMGFGEKNLTRLGDRLPKILPHNFCMIGIRSYEEGEQELLERLGVRVFFMAEVERRGLVDVLKEAQYLVTRNTVGYGMSIDIDGFDTTFAPAVGTPEPEGLNATEFLKALLTMDLRKLIATEIVEFLPERDDENRTSEKLVAQLVDTIYSTKFFQVNNCNKIDVSSQPSVMERTKSALAK